MIKPLVHDPLLLQIPATPASKEDAQVWIDLMDTLKAHLDTCAGMAANMIGVPKAIIVVNSDDKQFLMLNPVIISKKKPYKTSEGCLSYEGGPTECVRYDEIRVEFEDVQFKKHTKTYKGWTAQIIQHECDHLAGILI